MKKIIVILMIVILAGATGVLGYLQNQSGEMLDIAAEKITQLKAQIVNLEKERLQNQEPAVTIQTGKYTIDQVSLDAGGVSNEDAGFTINADGTFSANMGWGYGHSGTYEIQGKKLVCTSDLFYWESGSTGQRQTKVVFTFDVDSYSTLKLIGILMDDDNTDKLILPEAIALGNTYSVK